MRTRHSCFNQSDAYSKEARTTKVMPAIQTLIQNLFLQQNLRCRTAKLVSDNVHFELKRLLQLK